MRTRALLRTFHASFTIVAATILTTALFYAVPSPNTFTLLLVGNLLIILSCIIFVWEHLSFNASQTNDQTFTCQECGEALKNPKSNCPMCGASQKGAQPIIQGSTVSKSEVYVHLRFEKTAAKIVRVLLEIQNPNIMGIPAHRTGKRISTVRDVIEETIKQLK